MRERATLIGANLTIDGDPVAGGTRVRLEVPTGNEHAVATPTEIPR